MATGPASMTQACRCSLSSNGMTSMELRFHGNWRWPKELRT
jgi:hypothetical protein